MYRLLITAAGTGGLLGADFDDPEIPMEVLQTFPETLQPRIVKLEVGAISHTGVLLPAIKLIDSICKISFNTLPVNLLRKT